MKTITAKELFEKYPTHAEITTQAPSNDVVLVSYAINNDKDGTVFHIIETGKTLVVDEGELKELVTSSTDRTEPQ